ncbi:[protein-PII] uridylyltransferase [Rodentibacter pneumotropicus]|uniref:[protein-PII] uridylyltransferase n=1 Tax=Rodentibacter pneumotropicus TaxID=758 RepID=A0A3S4TWI8_9PAST|nr:[protein-PII] uridylyltransferase [Rodentibacter pneumotropicus]
MLFPFDIHSPLTPSAVKIQRENLKQFELNNFSQYSVFELIENRTDFYDALLQRLWIQMGLDKQSQLSLIAVGGYGRREMFPLSDLDFLVLTAQILIAEVQERIVQFVQFLWDCGFEVGHAVRTLAMCESEGREDITIATNLLEARFLAGNRPHFDALRELVKADNFGQKKPFLMQKCKSKLNVISVITTQATILNRILNIAPVGCGICICCIGWHCVIQGLRP